MHVLIFLCCIFYIPFTDFSNSAIDSFEPTDRHELQLILDDTLKLDDLIVPDGFLYRNYKEVEVNLELVDEQNQPLKASIYKILAIDHNQRKHLMMNGRTTEEGKIELLLEVPLHITELLVECQHKDDWNKQYYFAFFPKMELKGKLGPLR